MEEDQNARVEKHVALLLTDRLKEIWRNLMEEFQQSFDFNQLDSVLSLLRELDSTSQNSIKKKRLEFVQKGDGESENNNNESLSLEKKVFGNHLLAKSVFKYLPHSALLSCRLMNSYWNENSTEILLKRDFKIKFRRNINRFYLNKSNWKSLDMFTQVLRTSKQFPCNKFVFEGGNLGNDDAQRFFSFNGPCIKYIKISLFDMDHLRGSARSETGFSISLTDSRVIGMILSQFLPNLENLDLLLFFDETRMEWSHKSLVFPPQKEVKLPNLKSIKYYSDCHGDDALLRQLLLAATNLKRFQLYDCFKVDGLDNFIQTGKIKCIADLYFPTETEHLEKLEEMLKYEPKLFRLSLCALPQSHTNSETWTKISTLLTKLLSSSQESLEKIENFNSLGFLPQFQLPILHHVKELFVSLKQESSFNSQNIHDYSFALLPRGATFSKNFPRLHSVTLHYRFLISDDDAADWWTKYFPTDEIVPTVKEFVLYRGFCPLLWMEKLSSTFPNLEDLSVGQIKDFPRFSKIIWTSCRKLKNLTVGIDLSSPLNSHPALDSSFTGLSPGVCKKLLTFSKSALEAMAENYMENEPSLMDLTDLRALHINLEFYMDLSNYNYPKLLTPVTGICAFKPLESLREVIIKCPTFANRQLNELSILRNLEPLTPYKVKVEVNK